MWRILGAPRHNHGERVPDTTSYLIIMTAPYCCFFQKVCVPVERAFLTMHDSWRPDCWALTGAQNLISGLAATVRSWKKLRLEIHPALIEPEQRFWDGPEFSADCPCCPHGPWKFQRRNPRSRRPCRPSAPKATTGCTTACVRYRSVNANRRCPTVPFSGSHFGICQSHCRLIPPPIFECCD